MIFIFTNIVFIGAVNASYGYYLIREVKHSCGPYNGIKIAINTIYQRTNIITTYDHFLCLLIYSFLEILTFPPILIAVIFFFLGFAMINRNKSVVSDGFIKNKEREY